MSNSNAGSGLPMPDDLVPVVREALQKIQGDFPGHDQPWHVQEPCKGCQYEAAQREVQDRAPDWLERLCQEVEALRAEREAADKCKGDLRRELATELQTVSALRAQRDALRETLTACERAMAANCDEYVDTDYHTALRSVRAALASAPPPETPA